MSNIYIPSNLTEEQMQAWWKTNRKYIQNEPFVSLTVLMSSESPEEMERIKNDIQRRIHKFLGQEYEEYTSKW
jgi:predicted ATP-grasp superfamily ATP-dependent carboligase